MPSDPPTQVDQSTAVDGDDVEESYVSSAVLENNVEEVEDHPMLNISTDAQDSSLLVDTEKNLDPTEAAGESSEDDVEKADAATLTSPTSTSGGASFNSEERHKQKSRFFQIIMALLLVGAIVVPIAIVKSGNDSSKSLPGTTATPTSAPTTAPPTLTPTAQPSAIPTSLTMTPTSSVAPTLAPTTAAPTASPTTPAPTASPTTEAPTNAPSSSMAPTDNALMNLIQSLRTVSLNPDAFDDTSSAEYAAAAFVLDSTDDVTQRYAAATVQFATSNMRTATSLQETHECDWPGVSCNDNRTMTKLNWHGRQLTGSLPADVGLLSGLKRLDLGENRLRGSIPEGLFSLTALEELYLHSNRLTGQLSEGFAELTSLTSVFLSENRLTGPFPKGLGSRATGAANTRPLRYINLYNNSITGSIPEFMNLRSLYFFDVGYNQMTGEIPVDWYVGANSMHRMRHIYLDHNNFSGAIPEDFTQIAGGRLNTLVISNNNFSGEFPGSWDPTNFLQVLEIQNAGFTSIDRGLCFLSVFIGGELTSLRADCSICICGRPFCVTPICS